MDSTTISKKELYDLRKDLHNKTKLHEAARIRVKNLAAQVKAQKKELVELKEARKEDHALILELKRQLEELRAKIFKKKKKDAEDDSKDSGQNNTKKSERPHQNRTPAALSQKKKP